MASPNVHWWYTIFLMYIEPVSALVGAFYAIFQQYEYLSMTHSPSTSLAIPMSTSIVLNQLGNLYLFFAMVEALVLRSTSDVAVWRALLLPMLIADFGHLATVGPLGWSVYYDITNYNAMDWGNVPFVYLGATTRVAFLLGIGVGEARKGAGRKEKQR
ncbi:hypothetical protein FRB97_006368 [Tulasnella sp. 331]|nr:hypothetical protein FRB97_006368 [Tulasnella sp. 331]KAG8878902.1 hypothetical protein FRB98_005916 [Tulasnella sp. 332]